MSVNNTARRRDTDGRIVCAIAAGTFLTTTLGVVAGIPLDDAVDIGFVVFAFTCFIRFLVAPLIPD